MTKFSDWVLIPHNNKCYLPHDAKVQLMWRCDDVEHAEESMVVTVKNCLNRNNGNWLDGIFAYRFLIEPTEVIDTYDAWLSNGHLYRAKNGDRKGTATLTKIDGRGVKLVWEADDD